MTPAWKHYQLYLLANYPRAEPSQQPKPEPPAAEDRSDQNKPETHDSRK